MTRREYWLMLIFGALVNLIQPAVLANAQNYPSKPIKLIVPVAAGGLGDILARTFAQQLGESTSATVVVENRSGGGGAIGAAAVARAEPDGYTLMLGFHQILSILQHIEAKLPYDPGKDFAPIIHLVSGPSILLLHPAVPARTVKELVAYAKANPNKLTFASQGNGASGHIAGEQFKQITGVQITHVPYRGAGPAKQDLLAGHVSMMFDIVSLALPQVRSGDLVALGVAASARVSVLPAVPTLVEAGLPVEGGAWFGLLAPAGTPREIVEWLNLQARKAFSDPVVRDRFVSQGNVLVLGTPDEFGKHIAAESERWGEVIRRAGIQSN